MSLEFDITPYIGLSEDQHFESKSLFEGDPGKKTPRERKAGRPERMRPMLIIRRSSQRTTNAPLFSSQRGEDT